MENRCIHSQWSLFKPKVKSGNGIKTTKIGIAFSAPKTYFSIIIPARTRMRKAAMLVCTFSILCTQLMRLFIPSIFMPSDFEISSMVKSMARNSITRAILGVILSRTLRSIYTGPLAVCTSKACSSGSSGVDTLVGRTLPRM